jgi:hypothetical protein
MIKTLEGKILRTDVSLKAKTFDADCSIKSLVDEALIKLKEFRKKYPFSEDPTQIDRLSADDIISDTGQMGDFFRYIEHQLIALGHLTLYGSKVYHNIRAQLEDFKELLLIVVDKEKSIAEKVDAPWQEIKKLGGDSHIAKKIIFCFNYETGLVAPIFKTGDLEYFLQTINDAAIFPVKYESMSLGEKYEFLTQKIIEAKQSSEVTEPWEITYFSWFLYQTFPPPKMVTTPVHRKKLEDKTELEKKQQYGVFIGLLNELRRKERISAEQWREYSNSWLKNPEARQTLTDTLTKLK